MADYRAEYRNWCDNTYFDEDTRREVKELTSEEEIKDRFYKELEFGTGGLGNHGSGAKQDEPLYGKEGDTGTCKLYEPSELYGKKGGNRL